jgi:hypothetical protein
LDDLRTRRILGSLKASLDAALAGNDTLVGKLFEQWRPFFREAIDYREAFGGRKLESLRRFTASAGIPARDAQHAERFFFVLHTYFALLVKFLAWLALSRHLGAKLGVPIFGQLAVLPGDQLRNRLAEMEDGGIFRQYGLVNLLEGDFFRWYLSCWNEDLADALREMLGRLSDYAPDTLTVHPEETRDLFKKLYHQLLPREVRHTLGEYYTPDWLAQRLLNQVDNEFFLERRAMEGLRRKLREARWLDPACGSGTFLVLVIRRCLELGRELMVPEADLLEHITANVVGLDLNPLAVITARVNYLLAVGELLEHRRGSVTIPVYLADSILTPSRGEDLFGAGAYHLRTSVGTFAIPEEVFKADLDRFCVLLEESVRAEVASGAFVHRVEQDLGIVANTRVGGDLSAVYSQLLDLHTHGLNGLWARLIKNNFAPLTVGQFDYVVGNPPWVNWESLPNGYRTHTKGLWERYGLFPHGGMDAILGKGKKDISMLMTYTVADALLRDGGRLGFVITQSVFKSSGAGQGFRHFGLPADKQCAPLLHILHVDDMVALNPFEGAANRTAVVVLEKGRATRYPVAYTVWQREPGARFTYDSTIDEVSAATRRLRHAASPVDVADPTSSWLTGPRKAVDAIRKVLGKSGYDAHAGVYSGGANGVYWLETVLRRPDGLLLVRNITEGAKVKVESVAEAIEPDLVYPLLRSRDVARWRAHPSAGLLLVQDPVRRRGVEESELQVGFPRTHAYLKRFEKVLRARASRGVSDMLREGAAFYTMFAVGDYTFSPWKVVWPNIASRLDAAVVGKHEGKPVVPQHIVTLVACTTAAEAHYICALINSSCANAAAKAYSQVGGKSFGDPHILDHIRIPRFDPSDQTHKRLASLSRAAHAAVAKEDSEAAVRIEHEVDELAAKVWSVSPTELGVIRAALEQLG